MFVLGLRHAKSNSGPITDWCENFCQHALTSTIVEVAACPLKAMKRDGLREMKARKQTANPRIGPTASGHAPMRREMKRHLMTIAIVNRRRYMPVSFLTEADGLSDAYQQYRPSLGHARRLTAVIASTHFPDCKTPDADRRRNFSSEQWNCASCNHLSPRAVVPPSKTLRPA